MAVVRINKSVPLYASYFHAISRSDTTTDIFQTSAGVVNIQYRDNYAPYDIVAKIVKPLTALSIFRPDGNRLLVPLEGSLCVPTGPPGTGFPLLVIAHGMFPGYVSPFYPPLAPGDTNKEVQIKILHDEHPTETDPQVFSYAGYEKLQEELAKQGIASYSINLNNVNDLENNEPEPFNQLAIDNNQRIQFFFLHLKLLKMIAGAPLTISGTDEFPIKLWNNTSWVDLNDALQNDALNPGLTALKNLLTGKIDFTKIGLMGHSRGADTVSRIPAYFFKGNALSPPTFPFNNVVDTRNRTLSEQVGKPPQDFIKAILALEPSATVNDQDPSKHGYIIDNPQTMFFTVVGTHDEDVSFDAVRIYEYPQCSKAMIAINGASHKRFNEAWVQAFKEKKFDLESQQSLLSLDQHRNILIQVFSKCFTATLGGKKNELDFFYKKKNFPVSFPKSFYVQMAWKFGFPIQTDATILNDLDGKVTDVAKSDLSSHTAFQFEQHLKAFYVEKTNEGNFIIKIPIALAPRKLSDYTHFSFRFARGYNLSSTPERIEVKNFTIQAFDGNSALGTLIEGSNINTLELKALRALPVQRVPDDQQFKFEHSILLQTAEILLEHLCPVADQPRVNRIEITVVPDKTKAAPPSTGDKIFGSKAGAAIGAGIGLIGGVIYFKHPLEDDDHPGYTLIAAPIVGALGGGLIQFLRIKAETNAFVFDDFLLTKRDIP